MTSADYQACFNHADKIEKVALVAGGRAGTDFFQSLLDGHTQILQLPSYWFFYDFWNNAVCKTELSDLLEEFIWFNGDTPHIYKFKSKHNKLARMDALGIDKNQAFQIDIEAFKEHALGLLKNRLLSSRNFFLAVHTAYWLAQRRDIFSTRLLFYHPHHIHRLAPLIADFPSLRVICMIREPRNTLVAELEHWKTYNPASYKISHFLFVLDRLLSGAESISAYTNRYQSLRLEDLHTSPRETLQSFCNSFQLDFQECLLESTWNGLLWWGDAVSPTFKTGFNPGVWAEKWRGKITYLENLILESVLSKRLQTQGYPLHSSKIERALAFLFLPLLAWVPFRYECDIFGFCWKNPRPETPRLKRLASNAACYFLRVGRIYRAAIRRFKEVFTDRKHLGNSHLNSPAFSPTLYPITSH